MHRHRLAGLGVLLAVAIAFVSGCAAGPTAPAPESEDGVFTSLQARGEQVTDQSARDHPGDHSARNHGEDHGARDHGEDHDARDHGEDHP
jgi:hypothetical protein